METVGEYFARKQREDNDLCYVCSKRGEPAVYTVEHPEFYICRECLMELREYNPLLPLSIYVTDTLDNKRYVTMAPELHEAIENVGAFFGPAVVYRAVNTMECRWESQNEMRIIDELKARLKTAKFEENLKRRASHE